MAVKIKLKRLGKIREPYYRIIVADARTKRDGRAIEEVGKYHPKAEPSFIEVDSERVQHWLSVGAQPTDPVRKILEVTGDWQRFKGLPGAEGTLKTAAPRSDKKEAFAAALSETLAESGATQKRKAKSSGAGKSAEKAERGSKAERPEKAERGSKAEKPEKGGKAEKPEKGGKSVTGGKSVGTSGKPDEEKSAETAESAADSQASAGAKAEAPASKSGETGKSPESGSED